MRLLAIGFAIVAVVIALAVLFHKVDRLEDKIEEASKPRIHLIAKSVGPRHVASAAKGFSLAAYICGCGAAGEACCALRSDPTTGGRCYDGDTGFARCGLPLTA